MYVCLRRNYMAHSPNHRKRELSILQSTISMTKHLSLLLRFISIVVAVIITGATSCVGSLDNSPKSTFNASSSMATPILDADCTDSISVYHVGYESKTIAVERDSIGELMEAKTIVFDICMQVHYYRNCEIKCAGKIALQSRIGDWKFYSPLHKLDSIVTYPSPRERLQERGEDVLD